MSARRDPAQTAGIRHLWEDTPATAAEIAARFGITRNVVIGLAARFGWTSFNEWRGAAKRQEPETLFDRMDRLEARMNAVLAETKGVGRISIEASRAGRKGRDANRDFNRKAGLFNG